MATRNVRALAAAFCAFGIAGAAHGAERFGIGRPATEAEIAAWNIDIDRTGGSFRRATAASPTSRGVRGAMRLLPRQPG